MEFKDIVTISGMSGLFKTVSERKNGMIVSSLENDETKFISGRLHNFTTLENISVYTQKDNKALKDVLDDMKKQSATITPAEPKDSEQKMREYFEKIVPDYDKERVYISDIKKMIKWFHVLDKKGIIGKEEKKSGKKEEGDSKSSADKGSKPKTQTKKPTTSANSGKKNVGSQRKAAPAPGVKMNRKTASKG